jgi:hypothetical protein
MGTSVNGAFTTLTVCLMGLQAELVQAVMSCGRQVGNQA